MKFKSKLKNNSKAFSLLEVLVMLVIISFTIISAVSLVSKISISTKNNENEDVINGVLLEAIELLKSPSPVLLSSDGYNQVTTDTNEHNFALKDTVSVKYLQFNTNPNTTLPTQCSASDFYYVPIVINNKQQPYNLCMQIKIKRTLVPGTTANYYYFIQASILYNINGTNKTDTLTTYRYGSFEAH